AEAKRVHASSLASSENVTGSPDASMRATPFFMWRRDRLLFAPSPMARSAKSKCAAMAGFAASAAGSFSNIDLEPVEIGFVERVAHQTENRDIDHHAIDLDGAQPFGFRVAIGRFQFTSAYHFLRRRRKDLE